MKNIFITGDIGAGKSTLIRDLIKYIDVSIGGFIEEKVDDGDIVKFDMVSLYDGQADNVVGVSNKITKTGKAFPEIFDDCALKILKKSFVHRKVIIMDELGFMESTSKLFKEWVYKILDSERVVLGVIKKHDCEFLNSIRNRKDVVIFEVNKYNYDNILEKILDLLKKINIRIKEEFNFYFDEEKIELYNKALEESFNTYPNIFLSEIKKYVKSFNKSRVLDIGAGSGAFSIPLANDGAIVTAVDASFSMLNSMKKRAKKRKIESIIYYLSPWNDIEVEKHDICICAHTGGALSSRKNLIKMYNSIKKYAFIIVPAERGNTNFGENDLMKMLNRKLRTYNETGETMINLIEQEGYRYDYAYFTSELHQYIDSYKEGVKFLCNRFGVHSDRGKDIIEEFLKKRIIKKGKGYIIPSRKKDMMITIIKS